MAEWSKALVLRTNLLGGVGSNPTSAIIIFASKYFNLIKHVLLNSPHVYLNSGYMDLCHQECLELYRDIQGLGVRVRSEVL